MSKFSRHMLGQDHDTAEPGARLALQSAPSRALPRDAEATAFHVAWHVVAIWAAQFRLGRKFKIHSVSIAPKIGSAGRVIHPNPLKGIDLSLDGSPRAQVRGECAARICLAGPIAQRRFTPRSWRRYHGAADHDRAVGIVMSLAGSQRQAQAYMNLLTVQTEDMIEHRWKIMGRVAAALLERTALTGDQMLEVIVGGQDVVHSNLMARALPVDRS